MNSLPNKSTGPLVPSEQIAVTLLLTEKVVRTDVADDAAAEGRKLEAELDRRANAMTSILAGIMDRPAANRYWGLNE